MKLQPVVVSIAVSMEFGGEDFGKGTKSFATMSGKYPDPGVPFEDLDDVIETGVDYYLAAWKSLLTSRCATGLIDGKEWKAKIKDAEDRVAALHRVLNKMKQIKKEQEIE